MYRRAGPLRGAWVRLRSSSSLIAPPPLKDSGIGSRLKPSSACCRVTELAAAIRAASVLPTSTLAAGAAAGM